MKRRVRFALMVAVLGSIVRPVPAEACGCGGTTSSPTALKGSDLVFVGTVARFDGRKPWSRVNADGSGSVGLGTEPSVATFQVIHVFGGRVEQVEPQVVITGEGADCDVPFKKGEAWLVYAQVRDGRVTTNKCTRTRLRTEATASQDLAYLNGVEKGRQQGVVYGDVLRRVAGADGQPALQALFEPLQVIAVGPRGRFKITTDKWGPYQLVLPPGDYEIWVERAGRAVAAPQKVHVEHGSDRRIALVVDY